jgi:hypothetical protein
LPTGFRAPGSKHPTRQERKNGGIRPQDMGSIRHECRGRAEWDKRCGRQQAGEWSNQRDDHDQGKLDLERQRDMTRNKERLKTQNGQPGEAKRDGFVGKAGAGEKARIRGCRVLHGRSHSRLPMTA